MKMIARDWGYGVIKRGMKRRDSAAHLNRQHTSYQFQTFQANPYHRLSKDPEKIEGFSLETLFGRQDVQV